MERNWHGLRSSTDNIHQRNMLLRIEVHYTRNMPLTSHDMPHQPWQQYIRNRNVNNFLHPCYNLRPHMTPYSNDHLQHSQYIFISDVVTHSNGPQYHWWPISDVGIYSSGVQYHPLPISEVGTHSIGLNHEYGQPISGVGLGSGGAPPFEFYNRHGIFPPPPLLPPQPQIFSYSHNPMANFHSPDHLASLASPNSDTFTDTMSYEESLELEELLEDIMIANYLSDETTPNHLSEETIVNHLNTRTHVSSGNQDEEPEMCVVCQAYYEKNETIGRLGCGHEYHADCIKTWLLRRNVCPICKTTALII